MHIYFYLTCHCMRADKEKVAQRKVATNSSGCHFSSGSHTHALTCFTHTIIQVSSFSVFMLFYWVWQVPHWGSGYKGKERGKGTGRGGVVQLLSCQAQYQQANNDKPSELSLVKKRQHQQRQLPFWLSTRAHL